MENGLWLGECDWRMACGGEGIHMVSVKRL